VLVTDFVQFGITMAGTFAIAYFALAQPEVGGLSGLLAQVPPRSLNFLPDFGDWSVALAAFVLPLAVQWWAVWYPGAEPGGGSYIAQRMLASKTEKDAVVGTLLFNVMHYALRPWPWIIVALASLIVYPELSDISRAFPAMDPGMLGHDIAYPAMMRFLPAGFLGLVIAGLLAAYLSTIETHLNWGTSYLVHDFYRRFLRPGLSEKHYVLVGRLVTGGLMIVSALITYSLGTARNAFDLILSIGAGTGLLYLLRWFWWRVSAWSEIAAMVSSFLVALGFFIARQNGLELASHVSLLVTVGVTTVVWVVTTLVAPPTDAGVLDRFYMQVRPSGPGWKPIANRVGVKGAVDSLPQALLGWVLGCAFVYAGLFGTGSLLYGRMPQFLMWLAVFVVSGLGLARVLRGFWSTEA
jgi:SSS family solute:Na+ symporter